MSAHFSMLVDVARRYHPTLRGPFSSPMSNSVHQRGAELPNTNLDTDLAKSIAWMGGSRWLSQVITWSVTIVVARILTPADYGLVGMATVYWGLLGRIADFGLADSVMLVRNLTKQQIAQLHTLALLWATLVFALAALLAEPVAMFYGHRELVPIILLTNCTLLLSAIGAVPGGILEKELRYKELAVYAALGTIAGSLVTIGMAMMGFGYWSLVACNLAVAGVSSYLALRSRAPGFAKPELPQIRKATSIGFHVMGGQLAFYAYSNADYLIAGKVLGKSALGAYTFAYMFASIPVDKVTAMVNHVLRGYYASLQSDHLSMRRMVQGAVGGLGLVGMPIAWGLSLVAADAIPLLLGDQWLEAIAPLQVLAAYAAVRTIMPAIEPVLAATGQTRFMLVVKSVFALILPFAFWYGSRFGTVGIAAAWVAIHPLQSIWVFVRVRRTIDLTAMGFIRAIWPALSSGLVMTIAVLGVQYALTDAPGVLRLTASVATGATSYVGVLLLLHRQQLEPMLNLLKRLRRGTAPPHV